MGLVQQSTRLSLCAQLLTLLFGVAILAVPVNEEYEYRNDVLAILYVEGASQLVELAYYSIAVGCFFGRILTWTRYIDWFISTPVMIVSTAMFLLHRQGKDPLLALRMQDPLVVMSICLNQLMLSFGLCIELGSVGKLKGVVLGSSAFIASYAFLGQRVDGTDTMSVVLFFAIFFVWSLYGVAALFSYVPKNVSYNALDIVSKNFYGIFVGVYLVTR